MKQKFSMQAIIFFLTCLLCLLLRALLINLPNIEPVSSLLLCLGKRFNYIELFLFGFLNILFFDVITFKFGIWTIFTALTYALIAVGTYLVKTRKVHFLKYSIISTLVYDIITGLIMGPILFEQDFIQALVGQIPFTIYHIIGNLVLTISFTCVIEIFFWAILKRRKVLPC
ncbi:MAG: hypothetical protein P4L22_03015 [Candidatus Babeliales bacterium]|nr:hypothetical protein [Candidatus Babeliales bacterium]